MSFCLLALSGVEAATQFSDSAWEQWTPDYEKADLTDVLEKGAGNLTEEDYSLIYAQTGLTKIGTDRLLEKGDRNKIARIQESYFKKREVVRERFAPWTCWEKIEDDYAVIGEVRAGDIIVTSATHVLGFRYGHAALIVADDGTLIEANTPDSKSHRTWVSVFNDYASFMILRPDPERISDETRLNIAAYANEELTGIPYTVLRGSSVKISAAAERNAMRAHRVVCVQAFRDRSRFRRRLYREAAGYGKFSVYAGGADLRIRSRKIVEIKTIKERFRGGSYE